MQIPDAHAAGAGAGASDEPSNLGLRRFLESIFGLVSAAAFVVALWPGVLEVAIPGFRLEQFGGAMPVRFAAFFAFLIALTIRIRVSPGKRPARAAMAWAQFANGIGGTLVQNRRMPTVLGWEGGTTVRWESHGASIELSGYTDTSRNNQTRFQSDLRLTRAFRFYALPRNFLTKAFASSQVWGMILAGQKSAERESGTTGTDAAASEQMAFMVEKEVVTGDPMVDAAVILKSDNPDVAREFFSDAGVSHWLRELNGCRKGWQLSLVVKGLPDVYQLTLTIPGVLSQAKELDAGRQLMEAAVGRLADRGLIAHDRKAAGSGRS